MHPRRAAAMFLTRRPCALDLDAGSAAFAAEAGSRNTCDPQDQLRFPAKAEARRSRSTAWKDSPVHNSRTAPSVFGKLRHSRSRL